MRISAAVVSVALFFLIAISMVIGFEDAVIRQDGVTRTADIGQSIFERFVIPFEVVSVVLLAALIGGIVIARRDPDPDEVAAGREEVLG